MEETDVYTNLKTCTQNNVLRRYSELTPYSHLDHPWNKRLKAIYKTTPNQPHATRLRQNEQIQLTMISMKHENFLRTVKIMLERHTLYTTCKHAIKYKIMMDLQPFLSIKMQNRLVDEFEEAEHKSFISH